MMHHWLVLVLVLTTDSSVSADNALNPVASYNDERILQNVVAWQTMETLLIGCSTFPFSFGLECNRVEPPLRSWMSQDFFAAGYQDGYQAMSDTMMWLSIASQAREQSLKAIVKGTFVNATSELACNKYSFGTINTINELFQMIFQFATMSTGVYSTALASMTSRSLMEPVAQVFVAQARSIAVMRLLAGNKGMIQETRYNAGVSFAQANTFYSQYQTNCTNFALSAHTVRPFGRSYDTMKRTTNFTGSLSASVGMYYTEQNKQNDLLVLKFLLMMHRTHVALFAAGLQKFTSMSYIQIGRDVKVAEVYARVLVHEQSNVDMLSTMISQFTGEADPSSWESPCAFEFSTVLQSIFGFMAITDIMMSNSAAVSIVLMKSLVDTNLQLMISSMLINSGNSATFLNLISNGWTGNGYSPAQFRMGMSAVPVVSTSLAPDQWATSLPFSAWCADYEIPIIPPNDEPLTGY